MLLASASRYAATWTYALHQRTLLLLRIAGGVIVGPPSPVLLTRDTRAARLDLDGGTDAEPRMDPPPPGSPHGAKGRTNSSGWLACSCRARSR
jgi:hypothetical protein